ncbi:MAG: putative DNA-binding transcriptional regulator YafY [Candidatus Azotimanducaceae bacterium]
MRTNEGQRLKRISLEELKIIDTTIRSAARPTYALIGDNLSAEGYAASKSSILRALKYMRSEYGAPQVTSRRTTNPNAGNVEYLLQYAKDWDFEPADVTTEDLKSLRFAKRFLEVSFNHPAAADLGEAYDKLVLLSGPDIQRAMSADEDGGSGDEIASDREPIGFSHVAEQKIKRLVWRHLLQAARKKKCVILHYSRDLAWSGRKREPTKVKPYALVNLGGTWYMLGSGEREVCDIQQYHLSRIEDVKITEEAFTLPDGFDLDEILTNTFQAFIGDYKNLVDVKIRFSPRVAPLVLDHKFHDRQTVEIDKHTEQLTLTFPVTDHGASPEWRFYHVRSWVLRWGADAEVLEPEELRNLIRSDLTQMLKQMEAG